MLIDNRQIDGYLQNFINTTIGKIRVDDYNTATTKDFEELAVYNGSCYISDESLHQIWLYEDCDFNKLPGNIKTPFKSFNKFTERNVKTIRIACVC